MDPCVYLPKRSRYAPANAMFSPNSQYVANILPIHWLFFPFVFHLFIFSLPSLGPLVHFHCSSSPTFLSNISSEFLTYQFHHHYHHHHHHHSPLIFSCYMWNYPGARGFSCKLILFGVEKNFREMGIKQFTSNKFW